MDAHTCRLRPCMRAMLLPKATEKNLISPSESIKETKKAPCNKKNANSFTFCKNSSKFARNRRFIATSVTKYVVT